MDFWTFLSRISAWISAHPYWSSAIGFFALGIVVNLVRFANVYMGYILVSLGAALFAWMKGNWLYFGVFLLGMATAFTEIIGKFRDEPLKSFKTREALIYHVFNGLASMFALYVLIVYKWSLDTPLDRMKAVTTAGLGAMLFMRSRLFNVKVEKEDISFGPEQFVKVFLGFMEQAIGRVRAQARIDFVNEVMDNIKAGAVREYVVTMLGAVQLLDAPEKMAEKITAICDAAGDEQNKAYKLGYLLLDQGEDFVRKLFAEKDNHPEWLIRAPRPVPRREGLVARAKISIGIDKPVQPVAYFAYGESMSSKRLCERLNWTEDQMREAWSQTGTPVPAVLRGYKLVFSKVAAGTDKEVRATIVPDTTGSVEGVVYWLPDPALKFLDAPYVPGYRRAVVKTSIPDESPGQQRIVESQVYLADAADLQAPSSEYLRVMIAGAKEHGLSPEYIERLEAGG